MPDHVPPTAGRLLAMALARIVVAFVLLATLLFLPAGTFGYWQAWAYLASLLVPMSIALVYLLRHDRALLERRLRTGEKEPEQKLLVKLGAVCYVLVFVLAGLDRRWGWSAVPAPIALAADAAILAGYLLFIRVLAANSYAARVVEVEAGQRVVTTGPYAVIRHPMYAAVIAMFGAAPLALASWWAVLPAVPLVIVIVARIGDEERLLAEQLEGYREYMQATRYRLIPGLW